MRKSVISSVALALLLVAGCKNRQQATTTEAAKTTVATSASASSMSPEELGTLGAQIKKQPSQADQLLSQHGLNEQSFAAAIRKVSEKPDDAKRYAAAYKKAS